MKKDKFERVHLICEWCKKRYTKKGRLITHIGGNPSRYTMIVDAAINKYL